MFVPSCTHGSRCNQALGNTRMTTSPPQLAGLCTGWLTLLLLLLLPLCVRAQQHNSNSTALPATAYLVASMHQPSEPSNHSFNNLLAILCSNPAYDSIVITEDYSIGNPQGYPTDKPIELSKDLLITSPPGQMNTLSFEFLVRTWPLCMQRDRFASPWCCMDTCRCA